MAEKCGWSAAPIVYLTLKRCPHPGCGGGRFLHVWTAENGDGSRTQHQVCAKCSRRCKFVLEENPQSGDFE